MERQGPLVQGLKLLLLLQKKEEEQPVMQWKFLTQLVFADEQQTHLLLLLLPLWR